MAVVARDSEIRTCPECGRGGIFTEYSGTYTVWDDQDAYSQRTITMHGGFIFECPHCGFADSAPCEA